MTRRFIVALAVVSLITATIVVLGGCQQGGKSASKPNKAAPSKKKAPGKKPAAKRGAATPKTNAPSMTSPSRQVTVYFAKPTGGALQGETRVVEGEPSPELVLELLIAGPVSDELRPTVPAGTKLLDVKVNNGIAYVDFSRQFVDNHPGGSDAEIMTVYSIVNSLTRLNGIDKVAFKTEGKALPLLKGHLDLTQPLGYDAKVVADD